MADKTYANVADLVREMGLDEEMIDAVDQALERQTLMRQLMAMRAARGLSQGDVAGAMGCSQSRVSKMENSEDDELRYGDLRAYARAVGCELESGVRPNDLAPADEASRLAFAVHDRLSRMARLAQGDEAIAQSVAELFGEVLLNFSMIVGKAASAATPRIAIRLEMQEAAPVTNP
jgi:transcriptional regulator with XRE-family HTH domain